MAMAFRGVVDSNLADRLGQLLAAGRITCVDIAILCARCQAVAVQKNFSAEDAMRLQATVLRRFAELAE